jgi:hypothetical protein
MNDFLAIHRRSEYAILYHLHLEPDGPPPKVTEAQAWEDELHAFRKLSAAVRDYVFGSEPPLTSFPLFAWKRRRAGNADRSHFTATVDRLMWPWRWMARYSVCRCS